MAARLASLLFALALFSAPAAAQKVYRVGVVNFGSATPNVIASPIHTRMVERLAELGFREKRNLVIDWRYADASFERVAPLTRELVDAKADVIVTVGNHIARIVTEANPRTPMVSLSCDSFGSVSNYAKPNGNFTGVTCMSTELSPKRLEVAKQLVPSAKRAVYLHNPNQGATGLELTEKAAAALGVKIRPVEIKSPGDLDKALAGIAAERPDVLLVYPDALTARFRKEIAAFAQQQRLPAVYAYREFAADGGLISYGSTLHELAERAGELVAKILRGSKPGELPLQQATRVYLTINLKAARELGYTIPQGLLQRADFVIDTD
ncbi:MAG TPA: ABC transporter substrate-binding protein [Burkholderiales bacterium]|nr:ABC transporter substrate-binding protein [Burkholderiales bacterium]